MSLFQHFSHPFLKILGAIALVQALYWFLLAPFLFAAPSISKIDLGEAEYAVIDAPDLASTKAANYQPVQLPIYECCEPVYLSVKIGFELDVIPASGLGIIKAMSIDNFILRVNDAVIVSEGRMDLPDHTFHGQRPRLEYVPAAVLQKGSNTLHFITVRSGNPYSDIYSPLVGPYDQMREQASQRLWVMNEYRVIVASLLLMVSAFGVLLYTHSKHRLFAAWLGILSLTWAASVVFPFITEWPVGSSGRLIVFHAIHYALPIALFCLIDSWTEKPLIRMQYGMIALGNVALALAMSFLFFGKMPTGYDVGDVISHWLALGVGVLTLLRLGYHFAVHRENRVIEMAVLSLGAMALGLDAWSEITTQRAGGNLREAGPILLIGLSLAFLSRNFHLFKSAQEINDTLSLQLSERESELSQVYERERALLRKQAHQEERQRILTDMHDGLGSELMSLLVAAKRGKADPEWVADGLQSIIDEMRLMMESMDSVGESLAAALATFRDRIVPRVERTGLKLIWVGELDRLPELEGRAVMHVFRILQEAVTNVIKHAGASYLKIEIEPEDTYATGTRITISDDGSGFTREQSEGRGLANMKSRAKSFGGKLDIESTAAGVTLSLHIPSLTQKEPT